MLGYRTAQQLTKALAPKFAYASGALRKHHGSMLSGVHPSDEEDALLKLMSNHFQVFKWCALAFLAPIAFWLTYNTTYNRHKISDKVEIAEFDDHSINWSSLLLSDPHHPVTLSGISATAPQHDIYLKAPL